MPVFDERVCEQVLTAIERHTEREHARSPDGGQPSSVAASSLGLAILAVQTLAEDRSVSVEAVLDWLLPGSD
jgi:hypothetical protein